MTLNILKPETHAFSQPSAAPQNLNPAVNRKPYTWPPINVFGKIISARIY